MERSDRAMRCLLRTKTGINARNPLKSRKPKMILKGICWKICWKICWRMLFLLPSWLFSWLFSWLLSLHLHSSSQTFQILHSPPMMTLPWLPLHPVPSPSDSLLFPFSVPLYRTVSLGFYPSDSSSPSHNVPLPA